MACACVPEGDTVHVVARRLHSAFAGHQLCHADFRVPQLATARLEGAAVEDVHACGKHLFVQLSGGATVHSHLAMEGEWHLYRPNDSWRRPKSWARVVLATEEWAAVGFRLAKLELIETDRKAELFGYLGPDPLRDDWDPKAAAERLRRDPARSVGDALLDQRVIAGPGNVYKSEICFLRGLSPWAPVGGVDVDALVDITARLMRSNRREGMQVTTGDTRPGRHWVYGRAGQPCLRCGTLIRRQVADTERVTYWCPRCQPSMGAGT